MDKGLAEKCLKELMDVGMEKAEVTVGSAGHLELNADSGEMSLLRKTDNLTITLTGIIDHRDGSLSMNRTDDATIREAATRLLAMVRASQPDEANDISPGQPQEAFELGDMEPDRELMYERMKEFIQYCESSYPSLIMEQAILDFACRERHYVNSNGVDLRSRRGYYSFSPMFTSKEGDDTSSFNYSSVFMFKPDRALHEFGSVDTLLRQSTEQVRAQEFSGKFKGDIIITPDCLDDFINLTTMFLEDYYLIKGTSIFKDSLGREVASPKFTLSSKPLSKELAGGYFITGDGFAAKNCSVIEEGILRNFLLTLHGARKTGLERSPSSGGAYVVEPGESSLDEMIASVPKGLLLCRFSGGMPSESGDFSGVAKNSYLIQDGRIGNPVREVMISGNLRELLRNISQISRERINYGDSIFPWIKIGGVTVFGK